MVRPILSMIIGALGYASVLASPALAAAPAASASSAAPSAVTASPAGPTPPAALSGSAVQTTVGGAGSSHVSASPAVQHTAVPPGPPPSATTEVEVGNTTSGLDVDAGQPKAVVVTRAAAPAPAAVPLTLAQPKDLDPAPLQSLSKAAAALQAQASKANTDASMVQVRESAAATEASATSFAATRARTLAILDAELKKLSTKSGAARPHLSEEETRTRKALLAQRAELVAQIKAAQTVGAEAGQTYNAIASERRNSFTSKVFERTASPLEQTFWTSLGDSLGPDARRLAALLTNALHAVLSAPEPRAAIAVALAAALAFLIAVPLRRRLKRFSRRRAAQALSAGGLRRTAHAVGAVFTDTLLPGLAAVVLNLGFTWGEVLSDQAEALTRALVIAVFWGAAILALSRQLAGAAEADERLLPVSDRLAAHMRLLPWLVAVITGAGFLINRTNVVVGASVAATIAANCLISLAYAAVATLVLLALGDQSETEEEPARAPGRMILSLALIGAILVTVIAVFAGFSTFAALVARQIFWLSVLAALTYLFLRFADDLVSELFKPHGWIGRILVAVLNLRSSTIQQMAVLTSAALQVVIVLAAIMFALTPFGGNGDLLPAKWLQAGHVVHIGSIVISPRSVGAALVSLVIGLGLVNIVERWLDRRFLPVTDWDSGVRNSVSTGVRYLGIGLALLWALAAAGLGFRQIALVASALSVGIGFGLQQIVQNFVSGLILLVERPVKVGDWVNLGGGMEGDVRRIRVRATEIQTFDRTTVIVPNSDLITKQVQNKTLGDPRGRVTLKFSIGAAADAPRATEATLKLFKQDPEVLDNPEPRVFIDSLTDGGSVNFVCYAYVATPRDAYRVKSKLYGELIALFGQEKIGFIGGPATNILEPGPELKSFIGALVADAQRRASAAGGEGAAPTPG